MVARESWETKLAIGAVIAWPPVLAFNEQSFNIFMNSREIYLCDGLSIVSMCLGRRFAGHPRMSGGGLATEGAETADERGEQKNDSTAPPHTCAQEDAGVTFLF